MELKSSSSSSSSSSCSHLHFSFFNQKKKRGEKRSGGHLVERRNRKESLEIISIMSSRRKREKRDTREPRESRGDRNNKEAIEEAVKVKDEEKEKKDNEEVFVKTENISTKKAEEKLKEKIAIQREKRKIQEKLAKTKGIAEDGHDSKRGDGDDLLSWIEKTRRLEEEKRKAKIKEKMIQDMDEDVASLIEEEEMRRKDSLYNSRQLKGLKVGHNEELFKEGQQLVLTLRDRDILDEGEDDVLENVNLIDQEKAAKNLENKLKRPEYRPYDDMEEEAEFDEFGILQKKTRNLLSKYDEEIDGIKKDSFRLGSGGHLKNKFERAQELEIVKEKLRHQHGVLSLNMPAPKLAQEYYTEEEMAKFKKPKKTKRVIRKKESRSQNADIETIEEPTKQDHGSRNKQHDRRSEKHIPTIIVKKPIIKEEIDEPNNEIEEDFSDIPIEEDEAQQDLQKALEKTRRLKAKETQSEISSIGIGVSLEKLASHVRQKVQHNAEAEQFDIQNAMDVDLDQDKSGKLNMILDSTAEFCRNLGDIPTYGQSGNRDATEDIIDFGKEFDKRKKLKKKINRNDDYGMDDDEEDDDEFMTEDDPNALDDADMDEERQKSRGKWNEVNIEAEKSNSNSMIEEGQPILEEEPDVSIGLAGALKLAMKKGYLDKDLKKHGSATRQSLLEAQSYTIEEKFYEDDKVGRHSRERYNGPVSEFKDKSSYKPDIKLEYVDDSGKLLNHKEAFRYLSHKFHGKGPGKNKVDKRMKKADQQSKLRQMSSTDTPLGTVQKLREKQKELNSPYIILSGPNTTLTKQ